MLAVNATASAAGKRTVVAAAMALTAFGAVAFTLLPLTSLLRDFSCDDSFYYATIAREVATSGHSSFDGHTPTNGYQPLWMWLEVPVHWITSDPVAALRATRVLEVAIALVGCLCWLAVCFRIGVAAPAAALLLPFFVRARDLFVGMEAATSIATLGAAAWATLQVASPDDAVRRRWALPCGLLLATAVLARIDNLAFAVPATACLLWRRGPAADRGMPWRLLAAFVLPLAVWSIANFVLFDTAVPVSGLVKQWWSSSAPDDGLSRSWRRLCGLLDHRPARDGVWSALLLLALVGWRVRLATMARAFLPIGIGLATLAIGKLGYYAATVEPVLANYGWYFLTGSLTRQLCLVVAVDLLVVWLVARIGRPRLLTGMLAGIVVLLIGRQMTWYVDLVRRPDVDWELLSHDAALWLAANVPHDARVGSFDAGVIGYFAPQRVSNLDGLVSSFAFFAARRAKVPIGEELDREGIRFVANVVADPIADLRGRGLAVGPGLEWDVMHVGARTAVVDGAERRFVVLQRR